MFSAQLLKNIVWILLKLHNCYSMIGSKSEQRIFKILVRSAYQIDSKNGKGVVFYQVWHQTLFPNITDFVTSLPEKFLFPLAEQAQSVYHVKMVLLQPEPTSLRMLTFAITTFLFMQH